MPRAQHNPMSGMTLIALCRLAPDASWSEAKREPCTVTKGVMDYLREHYGADYAPNTRETFRRQVLHQFVQGGIADYNAFEPDLPTNSPRAHYAITEAALETIRQYGTKDWDMVVDKFLQEQGALVERYRRERDRNMVPRWTGTPVFARQAQRSAESHRRGVCSSFRSGCALALSRRHGQKGPLRGQAWPCRTRHPNYRSRQAAGCRPLR